MVKGDVADMIDGIRESFKSKLHVLVSAAEAAEMILRVDDSERCAPRKREGAERRALPPFLTGGFRLPTLSRVGVRPVAPARRSPASRS